MTIKSVQNAVQGWKPYTGLDKRTHLDELENVLNPEVHFASAMSMHGLSDPKGGGAVLT
jgi:hypothetical protein